MTTIETHATGTAPAAAGIACVAGWVTTTDHKRIGRLYLGAAALAFLGPNAQTLYGAFSGATANGVRSLYVRDDAGVARPLSPEVVNGEIKGGWCLELLPSTAAGVEVSGRVLTPDGRGLRNATVTITDSKGVTRTAVTGSFGNYRFEDVEVGTYVLGGSERRYRFTSRVIQVTDSLTNVDLVGRE